MIYETQDGYKSRFGINYWFPKNNRTLFRIIVAIPFWAVYSTYVQFETGNLVKGWRIKTLYIRFRKRNKLFEWVNNPRMNLITFSVQDKEARLTLLETLEQREDRGIA